MLTLARLILIAGLLACAPAMANVCKDALTIEVFNVNGAKPIEKYENPNFRTLSQYGDRLGSRFAARIHSADRPTRWLDNGGGYGVAGLEAVLKIPGAEVTVINAQDAWSPVINWRERGVTPRFNKDEIASNGRLVQILRSLGKDPGPNVVNIDQYGIPNNYVPNWKEIALDSLAETAKAAMASGRFDYRVGFAEEVLPNLPSKSYTDLSDLYGAYYYSGSRVEILEQDYRVLDEGGEGDIIFHTDVTGRRPFTHGPQSTVRLKNGKTISLEDYLVSKYPTIFTTTSTKTGAPIEMTTTKILHIRRDPKIEKLELSDHLSLRSKSLPTKGSDFQKQLPTVEYEER